MVGVGGRKCSEYCVKRFLKYFIHLNGENAFRDMAELGYWALPFVRQKQLEDWMDDHPTP
jgi:hypothetical protein